MYNPYENMLEVLDRAAGMLGLKEATTLTFTQKTWSSSNERIVKNHNEWSGPNEEEQVHRGANRSTVFGRLLLLKSD